MDIGKKVKLALAYIGISEAELARRLEISPQSLNKRLKTGKFEEVFNRPFLKEFVLKPLVPVEKL